MWSDKAPPETIIEIDINLFKGDMEDDYCIMSYTLVGWNRHQIRARIGVYGSVTALIWDLAFKEVPEAEFENPNAELREEGCSMWTYQSQEVAEHLFKYTPEAWPLDSYQGPTLVLAIDGSVFVRRVNLACQLCGGYEASMREVENLPLKSLGDRLSRPASFVEDLYGARAPWGPFDNYFVSEISMFSVSGSEISLVIYLMAVSYFVYLTVLLAAFRLDRLADRLKILVGVTFALFGFIWGFRQILPSRMTYWETTLVLGIVAWGVTEYVREFLLASKRKASAC